MKQIFVLSFLALSLMSHAVTLLQTHLGDSAFADTEVSSHHEIPLKTNGFLHIHFNVLTSPSNNLTIAIGQDENHNSKLDVEEQLLIIGWDCGNWFYQDTLDKPPQRIASLLDSSEKELTLELYARDEHQFDITLFENKLLLTDFQLPLILDENRVPFLRLTKRGLPQSETKLVGKDFGQPFSLIIR